MTDSADGHAGSEAAAVPGDEVAGGHVEAWVELDPMLGEVVVSADQLARRVTELGVEITRDYADRPPLLVGVLKGAFVFLADLSRAIALPAEMDFMAVGSYGAATKTSGVVRIVKDLDLDLTGRHVIVVEDIVDSGLTLAYLRKSLLARNPASLAICTLLLKTGQQRVSFEVDYVGFEIPPHFVIGYGLDVAERYRNLADLPRLRRRRARVRVDRERAARAVTELLIAIGEDPTREGLLHTPERVASLYGEIMGQSSDDPAEFLTATFAAEHDEMVMVRDIPFASLCEHHLLPFLGRAHVAYIPSKEGRITGLSKLARVVDGFAGRLQVQERMTTQIAEAVQRALGPRGVLVVIEAEHLCMSMRGVRKPGSTTVTSAVRGLFRSDERTRAEAMAFIHGSRGRPV